MDNLQGFTMVKEQQTYWDVLTEDGRMIKVPKLLGFLSILKLAEKEHISQRKVNLILFGVPYD